MSLRTCFSFTFHPEQVIFLFITTSYTQKGKKEEKKNGGKTRKNKQRENNCLSSGLYNFRGMLVSKIRQDREEKVRGGGTGNSCRTAIVYPLPNE